MKLEFLIYENIMDKVCESLKYYRKDYTWGVLLSIVMKSFKKRESNLIL
ncbi:MAG: hypothetical protein QW183_03920 [Saccharolobus sp.]